MRLLLSGLVIATAAVMVHADDGEPAAAPRVPDHNPVHGPMLPSFGQPVASFGQQLHEGTFHGQVIARAHGQRSWLAKSVLQADVTIQMIDRPALNATITYDIRNGRTRIDVNDCCRVILDGQEIWMSPPDAPIDDPTFLITLWPQALIAPLSLGDPRTTCLLHGRDGMRSMILINFEAAAAFWPNDWFLADVESWN